jgi:hypothetical protein
MQTEGEQEGGDEVVTEEEDDEGEGQQCGVVVAAVLEASRLLPVPFDARDEGGGGRGP